MIQYEHNQLSPEIQFSVVQEFRNKYPMHKYSNVALMILMEVMGMDVERVLEANYVALAPIFLEDKNGFIEALQAMEEDQLHALWGLYTRQQLEKSYKDLAYGEEPPF